MEWGGGFSGAEYFKSLPDGERKKKYINIYNQNRQNGMNSDDAMNIAQQETMEQPEAPEQITAPFGNQPEPERPKMQSMVPTDKYSTWLFDRVFGNTKKQTEITDADKATAGWQQSRLSGADYFSSLKDPQDIQQFRDVYNKARMTGDSEYAFGEAQKAVEGRKDILRQAAERKIKMNDASADVFSVMPADAFDKMNIQDQDIILNAWENAETQPNLKTGQPEKLGIDAIIRAMNDNKLWEKYGIEGGGWNPEKNMMERGNVPIEQRHITSSQALRDAGWDVEGDEGATVYSMQYSTDDSIFHMTPIMQDKTVLRPEELDAYVGMLRDSEDPEEADKLENGGKGLLLWNQPTAGVPNAQEIADKYDEDLHNQQADYYGMSPKPVRPESREPAAIQREIEQLQYEIGEGEKRLKERPDMADETGAYLVEAYGRLTELKVELNQATTDWDNYQDALQKQYGNSNFNEKNETPILPEPLLAGTGEAAFNAASEALRGIGGDVTGTLAYGAKGLENLLGVPHYVSDFFHNAEAGWKYMEGLARKAKEHGIESATQRVVDAMQKLGANEQLLKDARQVTSFIEQNVVANPSYNLAHMLPSFYIDIMTGGASKAYDIGKAGAEAIGALGGRSLVQQLAGGMQAAMSNPGFGAVFASEFFSEMDDKIEKGENPTMTDTIWTLMGSYVNALIEYGGDDVASGFQALLMEEVGGLKGFIHSEVGETVEELTQLFTGRFSENVASVLQGKGTKYALYSDKPGEALISLAEYWETTYQTLISTGMMSGAHYASGVLREGLIRANMGQELTEEQRAALQAFTDGMNQMMEDEQNHQQFEDAVNHEETQPAEQQEGQGVVLPPTVLQAPAGQGQTPGPRKRGAKKGGPNDPSVTAMTPEEFRNQGGAPENLNDIDGGNEPQAQTVTKAQQLAQADFGQKPNAAQEAQTGPSALEVRRKELEDSWKLDQALSNLSDAQLEQAIIRAGNGQDVGVEGANMNALLEERTRRNATRENLESSQAANVYATSTDRELALLMRAYQSGDYVQGDIDINALREEIRNRHHSRSAELNRYRQMELDKIRGLDRRSLIGLRDQLKAGEDIGLGLTIEDLDGLIREKAPQAVDLYEDHDAIMDEMLSEMDDDQLMAFANGTDNSGTPTDRQKARELLNQRRAEAAQEAVSQADGAELRKELEARKQGEGADKFIGATDEMLENELAARADNARRNDERGQQIIRETKADRMKTEASERTGAPNKTFGEMSLEELRAERERMMQNPGGYPTYRFNELNRAISTKEAQEAAERAAVMPEKPNELVREWKELGETELPERVPGVEKEDQELKPEEKPEEQPAEQETEQKPTRTKAQQLAEADVGQKPNAEQENRNAENAADEQQTGADEEITENGVNREEEKPNPTPVTNEPKAPDEQAGAQEQGQRDQEEQTEQAEQQQPQEPGEEPETQEVGRTPEERVVPPVNPETNKPAAPDERAGEQEPGKRDEADQTQQTEQPQAQEPGEPPETQETGRTPEKPVVPPVKPETNAPEQPAEEQGQPQQPQQDTNEEQQTTEPAEPKEDKAPETETQEGEEEPPQPDQPPKDKPNQTEEDEVDRQTRNDATTYGFKTGRTNGDGRNDNGVHLVRTGTMSADRLRELQLVDRVAKHFGFSVEVSDGLEHGANGMYKGGRTIYLNKNTGNAFQTVAGHEMYHMVTRYNAASAAKIERIFDRWAESAGFDVEHEIDSRIAAYAKHGVELSRADAKEELIANSMYGMLNDRQTLQRIYASDRGLFNRVMEFVKRVQDSIRDMLRGYEANTPEARMLAKQAGALDEIYNAMLEELDHMKSLDETKKAAASVKGNGEATRKYEQAVNEATDKREITQAGRELGADILRKTGNQASEENLTRLMDAAEAVAEDGVLPSKAMRDNGLRYDANDPEVNRALNMLGGYMHNLKQDADTDSWWELRTGERLDGRTSTQYSLADMMKLSWNQQLQRVLDNDNWQRDDVFAIASDQDMANYSEIGKMVVSKKSVINKAMRKKKDNTSISAHAIDRKIIEKLQDAVKDPAAVITNGPDTIIVTDLDDGHGSLIIVALEDKVYEGKYNTKSAKSIYGRENMTTLLGSFVNGQYVLKPGVKLKIYKNNAIDILKTGSEQYGTQQQVTDALKTIAQYDTNVNKRFSLNLSNDEALNADLEQSNGEETNYGDHKQFSLRVTDREELDFLDNQKPITTYKTMQLVDGHLYPPMAAVVAGNMEDYSELGSWEKATEHPELIKNGNKFTLNKGKGKGSLDAAYNPYMHSSNLMINDQFSGAWNRPNLVTVECVVPSSEKTSGYHAEFAKDSVGWHSWHTGTVAGQLRNAKGTERQVFLSRWIKPVRIVPDSEVADHYAKLLEGTNIEIPDNVVYPSLLEELKKKGVPIKVTGKVKAEKYSLPVERKQELDVQSDDGEQLTQGMEGGTVAKFSFGSWRDTDISRVRQSLIDKGFDAKDVDKWIADVNSIAAMIAEDRTRLDYKASEVQTFLKDNAEYVKTLDSSTLCAKRRLYQGTFDAIQHALPNTVITSDLLIHLRNMMAERGYETPCGICYVESRRRNLGAFTDRFLKNYESDSTGYKPTMDDLTTTDGLEALRTEHPEAYEAYRTAMAKTGSNNPKVVQPRTEYRNEIMQLTPSQVQKILEIGGLRVQSFSDFETPHLIDMMQAVLDMAEKKLTSQAYTKVPNFAAVFGGTGIKINLSLIADGTGLDQNGNLIYSSYEGMDIKRALELRDQYPDDVGTILVGVSDEHILAAMKSGDIDFIIPFHKSGWGKKQLEQLTAMRGYHDYTADQNERRVVGKTATGKPKLKKVEENFHPVDYWDYSKSGKENAQIYLDMCAKDGRIPKFARFLVNNGDGSYSLQPDGSTDGYWKLLGDFKMYNHKTGKGTPQRAVTPNFNMEEAQRVMGEYEGGADTLPVAHDVVDDFVDEYKGEHPRARYSLPAEARARDAEYMQAVESGDEKKQQQMVDQAAKDAGYDTPKLYHGSPAFGFTEFDMRKGEGYIFASSDRKVAETYSGQTDRSRISERTNINTDELHGNELLKAAQKHLGKYDDYHLMTEDERADEADLTRTNLKDYWRLAKEFVSDHDGAFNQEKQKIVDDLVKALENLSHARNEAEIDDAWSRWDNGLWDLKWMDESIADELMQAVSTHSLNVYKNRLSDFMYGGDMYCDNGVGYYIFDNQLAIELDSAIHKGVYEMYGKAGKQLVIDCKGANWNAIEAPEELHLTGPQRTRDIAAAAEAYGYDSVLLKNLYDMGDYGYRAQSDIYIFPASSEVKSADPVTYDDQGNVIPLSQRFNRETGDIRYSLNDDDTRAGMEMYDRQMEFTGGQTQLLQRRTGDLWKTIAQRKAQQKAEDAGSWRGHVGDIARTIIADTNSTVLSEKQLTKRLTEIFEEHERMKADSREDAENAVNDTLNDLQGLLQEALSDQLYAGEYQAVRNALRKGIYLNPDQVKELGGAAELRDFRNAMAGFCRVYTGEKAAKKAGAIMLEGGGWAELHKINPDLFSDDLHWLERAQALRDYVDLNSNGTARTDPMTKDFVQSEALQLLAQYYMSGNSTEDTQRIRDALQKAEDREDELKEQQTQLLKQQADLSDQLKAARKAGNRDANAIDKLNKQLQAAREQTRAISKERTKAVNEQRKLYDQLETKDNKISSMKRAIDDLKEMNKKNQRAAVAKDRARAKQRAADVKARNNIKKTEMKMRRMLEKPSNTAYVPLDMVRQLLNMVEAIQKADPRKAAQATESWMRAMRELKNDTNNVARDAYDEGFTAQMDEVAEILKDRTINSLDSDELQFVSNTVTQALHQIENATKMIGREKNTDALIEAHSWTDTINAQKPRATGGIAKAANSLMTEHLTPQRELEKLAGFRKDNAISRSNEELSEGQRQTNIIKMNSTKIFEPLLTGENAKKFRKWTGKYADVVDTGIQGSRHGTFKMTHDFLTTILMHSMNQQNIDGMKNGLTVPDYQLWKQGKYKEAWDRAERMRLSESELKRLAGMATEYDKQWAKAWKEYQEYITPLLNDASMKLNGWHRFMVENYFPIRRDGNYLATDFESLMSDNRIASMGFTKLRKNATNPMMLESMYDVVNRTINGSSLYAGMLIPVTNFNKVFNMSMPGYEDSPKAALRRIFGSKEMEYIERMMKDLQQAGIKADSSFLDKVRGKAAPAALGANMTVVIKQAASYPTAAAVLGWKPLVQQLTKPRKFDRNIVDKYTSAFWERSDANIQAMNANVQNGNIDRTSSFLNKPIGMMDRATVRMIWGACEYAVEEQQPGLARGSDEYYKAVAQLYDQALEMTQPEYGTMQRPHIMRSNNTLMKAMTMYKTQSFQNLNILYDAAADYNTQRQMYKQNQSAENKAELYRAKTKLARAVSSQVVSAAVLAIMTAVGKALLHRPEPYQDDKGEITAKSAAYQLSKDAIGSMAGMMVGGSELYDLIMGIAEGKAPYDIEAGSISLINDLYQSVYKLGNAAGSIGDSSLTTQQKLEKLGKAGKSFAENVAAAYGIPAANVEKIFNSAYQYVDDIASGRGLEGFTGDVTLTVGARYMGEALMRGDKDTYVRMYNRMTKQGKTASQINTALRSWMKTGDPRIRQAATAIEEGDVDTYNRLINAMVSDGLGMANAVAAVEAVRKKDAKAEDESGEGRVESGDNSALTYEQIMDQQAAADAKANPYTAAQMNALLEDGDVNGALAVQKQLFKTKGTTSVKSSLTSYWKPKYRQAYQDRNSAELNRITRLLKKMGLSESTISKWKNVDSDAGNYNKKSGFGSGFSGFGSSSKSSRYRRSKKSSGFGSGGFGSGGFGSGW